MTSGHSSPTPTGALSEPERAGFIALAAAYHASARAELIARIAQRDTAIVFYLGAVSVVAGFVFGQSSERPELLYVVPLLSFGVSLLYAQHNDVIGALGTFLAVEHHRDLASRLGWEPPRQWDTSRALTSARSFTRWRYGSSLLLIVLPAVASLIVATVLLGLSVWSFVGVSVGGAATVGSLVLLVVSQRGRARRHEEIRRTHP